jgi:hypothetical protein
MAATGQEIRMRSPVPPRMARWLLNHFGCGPNNDAVIGDLNERYRQGRSYVWYWKQVLTAIAAGLHHSRRTLTSASPSWAIPSRLSLLYGVAALLWQRRCCWLEVFSESRRGTGPSQRTSNNPIHSNEKGMLVFKWLLHWSTTSSSQHAEL